MNDADDPILDSPNHLGETLAELAARGYERINDPRTRETRRCCCPQRDARDCARMRYPNDRPPVEPCECACHEDDDETDDDW
jgi:hypothetical protein